MKTLETKECGFLRKVTILLAAGFGFGLSPIAPGTLGTLVGALIVVGLRFESLFLQALLAIVLALCAVPLCGIAEKHFGKKDDSRIVADEYLTFPICVIGLPWMSTPWFLLVAFLTHRILDIVKPFPAYRLQKLGGGTGIVIDDVISSIYALALNHAIYLFWSAGMIPFFSR
jgi:phosphatidylglycerophosphatase A